MEHEGSSQVRKVLGRGLVQLIGEQNDASTKEIPVDAIEPNPDQPRKEFDEQSLQDLAQSIRTVGLLQPIVVKQVGHDRFQIIAGERRWRAAKLAGVARVPVVVRTGSATDSLALALVENLQREDLHPLEAAEAYAALMERFGLTQEEVAERVGRSRSAIANALRLLKLPEEIREGLASGKISEGHARALLGFQTEAEMIAAYRRILAKGLSVRDVERMVREGVLDRKPEKPRPAPTPLEQAASERLGVPVRIVNRNGKGKLEIPFYSEEDLDRVLSALGIRLND
ncbi:MAG: chromosome partitioning protein ParB [Fimbriimonadales bacterium]|nr:MAG: chromosome partitioning protein ParB [Fimbriimonadales bacterium]